MNNQTKSVKINVKTYAAYSPQSKHNAKKANSVKHHEPKRSTTLMREAVRKPQTALKRNTKIKSVAVSYKIGSAQLSQHTPIAVLLRPRRYILIDKVRKSDSIRHFAPLMSVGRSEEVFVDDISVPEQPDNLFSNQPEAVLDSQETHHESSTTADVLQRAIDMASGQLEVPAPKTKHRRRLIRVWSHR